MGKRKVGSGASQDPRRHDVEAFWHLSRRIARYGDRGVPRIEFLREISNILIEFSGCDAIEIWLSDGGVHYRWEAVRRPEDSVRFEIVDKVQTPDSQPSKCTGHNPLMEEICERLLQGRGNSASPHFTKKGSFWTSDADKPLLLRQQDREGLPLRELNLNEPYRSLLVMPLVVDDQTKGLLQLKSARPGQFSEESVDLYECLAESLGIAIAHRRAQARLRERVKEMTCLHGIAQIAQQPDYSIDKALQEIVQLLPPAWQFPESAEARIVVDGEARCTPGFLEGHHTQSAEIPVGGQRRGSVEIVYKEDRPDFAAGPFLQEEQSLIESVAREIALVIERTEAAVAKTELQEQLRHADRLATIGQLAAGVAHELNEPLGNILGFAQLAQKCPDLPLQAERDVEQIVKASLRGREIIKKLLLFSRQTPSELAPVDLNWLVRDGLYFLESRCAKTRIELRQELASGLPHVMADSSQLRQVLVNLVVNAIQAMPLGGILTVRTRADDKQASLVVEDTGVGMSEQVKQQLFLPFFTTKDVGEGTGLGLSVVHGIVTSHKGSIHVQSTPGKGSRFEVQLSVCESNHTTE